MEKEILLKKAKVIGDISTMKDIYNAVVACSTITVANSTLPPQIKNAWSKHQGQVHVFQTTTLPACLALASTFYKRITESGLKAPTLAFLQNKKGGRYLIAFANPSRFAQPINESTLFKLALAYLLDKYGDNYDYLDSRLLSAVSPSYRTAIQDYRKGDLAAAQDYPSFRLLEKNGLA